MRKMMKITDTTLRLKAGHMTKHMSFIKDTEIESQNKSHFYTITIAYALRHEL